MVTRIVCFACKDLLSPNVRYRAKFPLEELTKQGIRYHLIYPTDKLKLRIRFFFILLHLAFFAKTSSTVLYLQNLCGSTFQVRFVKALVRFRKFRMVYDLYAELPLEESAENRDFFIARATAVTLASKVSLDFAKQFNSRLLVLPTPIPDLGMEASIQFDESVVGWIGGCGDEAEVSDKQALYDLILPAFLDITYPIKLVLLGVKSESDARLIKTYFRNSPFVKLEIPLNIDWQNEELVQRYISRFDLGLVPILSNEYTRGKSDLALKHFVNAGVPVLVGSAIKKDYGYIESSGGFLCDTPEEFLNGINAILLMSKRERTAWRNSLLAHKSSFSLSAFTTMLLNEFQHS